MEKSLFLRALFYLNIIAWLFPGNIYSMGNEEVKNNTEIVKKIDELNYAILLNNYYNFLKILSQLSSEELQNPSSTQEYAIEVALRSTNPFFLIALFDQSQILIYSNPLNLEENKEGSVTLKNIQKLCVQNVKQFSNFYKQNLPFLKWLINNPKEFKNKYFNQFTEASISSNINSLIYKNEISSDDPIRKKLLQYHNDFFKDHQKSILTFEFFIITLL